MLELAADRLDAAIEQLIVHAGVISVGGDPERSITYAELMVERNLNAASH